MREQYGQWRHATSMPTAHDSKLVTSQIEGGGAIGLGTNSFLLRTRLRLSRLQWSKMRFTDRPSSLPRGT